MTHILLAFFPPSCVFLLSPTFPPHFLWSFFKHIASPQHSSLGPSIFSHFTPELQRKASSTCTTLDSWLIYPPLQCFLSHSLTHWHSVVSDSFVTQWTVACQAPQPVGDSWQEYWSGMPFILLQGIFLTKGLNPSLLGSCIGRQILYH